MKTYTSIALFMVILAGSSRIIAQNIPSLKIDIPCIIAFSGKDEHFKVFRAEEDVAQFLVDYNEYAKDCFTEKFGMIDFKSFELVGFLASLGGCADPSIEHTLRYSSEKDQLIIDYDVKQLGICKVIKYFQVWLLIPKQKESTSISYTVEYMRR